MNIRQFNIFLRYIFHTFNTIIYSHCIYIWSWFINSLMVIISFNITKKNNKIIEKCYLVYCTLHVMFILLIRHKINYTLSIILFKIAECVNADFFKWNKYLSKFYVNLLTNTICHKTEMKLTYLLDNDNAMENIYLFPNCIFPLSFSLKNCQRIKES